jgi:hypothetical protein
MVAVAAGAVQAAAGETKPTDDVGGRGKDREFTAGGSEFQTSCTHNPRPHFDEHKNLPIFAFLFQAKDFEPV